MKDWKKLVGAVAPTLATFLGGPLAGLATTVLSKTLLGREDGSEEELAQALLHPNPETMLALKKAEQDFVVQLKELDIKEEEVHQKDRDSARQRDIQTKDGINKGLALMFTLGFFAVLYAYMTMIIPDQAAQPLNLMLGALTAGLLKILDYYFGSSKGSADKTAMLAVKEPNASSK